MIPTLLGRLQTRFVLFLFVGLPVTLLYALFLTDWTWPPRTEPFLFLIILLFVGWIADFFYMQIQRFRWDNDWPFAFQFFFSILEFLATFGIVQAGTFDTWHNFRVPFETALYHFLWVFGISFLVLVWGLQILLIRWRFKGGELGRHRA